MLLKKLPGFARSPSGLEWQLLKRLPLATVAGLTVIAGFLGTAHVWPPAISAMERDAWLMRMDFVALGVLLVFLTLLFTVFIGCVIVLIMKGPAYVADAYPLSDRDQPLP
jgi:hypothetical protein